MSDTDWLLLSDCRNPHLSLAAALKDGRTVEYWNGRRWVLPDIYETGKDLSVRGLVDWSRYRIQPRQPNDEPGPCPVCGEDENVGMGFIEGQTTCSNCGFSCNTTVWNRLWMVD